MVPAACRCVAPACHTATHCIHLRVATRASRCARSELSDGSVMRSGLPGPARAPPDVAGCLALSTPAARRVAAPATPDAMATTCCVGPREEAVARAAMVLLTVSATVAAASPAARTAVFTPPVMRDTVDSASRARGAGPPAAAQQGRQQCQLVRSVMQEDLWNVLHTCC